MLLIGWGSFAILAVQLTGCTVDTLTLSSEQAALTRERIKSAGFDDLITVHMMDYRLAPLHSDRLDKAAPSTSEASKEPDNESKGLSWLGCFDRFVAIEMMEHVGKEYLADFWKVADKCLKPSGDAIGVVQLTTLPEARMPAYINNVDFIQKWVRYSLHGCSDCASNRHTPSHNAVRVRVCETE